MTEIPYRQHFRVSIFRIHNHKPVLELKKCGQKYQFTTEKIQTSPCDKYVVLLIRNFPGKI